MKRRYPPVENIGVWREHFGDLGPLFLWFCVKLRLFLYLSLSSLNASIRYEKYQKKLEKGGAIECNKRGDSRHDGLQLSTMCIVLPDCMTMQSIYG